MNEISFDLIGNILNKSTSYRFSYKNALFESIDFQEFQTPTPIEIVSGLSDCQHFCSNVLYFFDFKLSQNKLQRTALKSNKISFR